MPGTSALRDVELVSVGTWAASTGVTTITRPDLEAMLAAHADRVVDAAPVKLGHLSDLNKGIGDGEPAFGWVVPKAIRKGANGRDTLVGDLVGMPTALAEAAPTAYRRRSVEVAWGVRTPDGKRYAAVLTAVSLLGARAPAVKGLADVLALYAGAAPQAERTDVVEVVAGLEDRTAVVILLAAARHAGATVEVLDALASAGGARDTADVPTPSDDDDHDAPSATTPPPTQEARPMATYSDEQLRTLLNLEADADVDAALKQLATAPAGPASDPATPAADPTGGSATPASSPTATPAAPATPATPAAPATPATPATPAPAEATPELATLSAATLAELQRDAAWARDQRRASVLNAAVAAGRIAPAERGKLTSELGAGEAVAGFAAALERDEAGTTTLLTGLSPRFPVTEFGSDVAPTTTSDQAVAKAFDEFEASTFGVDRTPAS